MTSYLATAVALTDIDLPWSSWFTERFARGAFTDALRSAPNVYLLDNEGYAIARTNGGGLLLQARSGGLQCVAQLDENRESARRIISYVERGIVDGARIDFRVAAESWSKDFSERLVTAVDLDGAVIELTWSAGAVTPSPYRRQRIEDFSIRRRRELAGSLLGRGTTEAHGGVALHSEAEFCALAKTAQVPAF